MNGKEIQSNNSSKLGMSECIMIAVGGMMGSSIFTLSGVTYGMAGPSAMVSWAFAGIVLLLYAMSLAELATTFQTSGGIFIYPYKILGKTENEKSFWGWISAWSWLNVSILGVAFSAICVVTYLQEYVPLIKENPMLYLLIPAIWILICFVLNAIKTSFLGKINGVLTVTLLVICVLYILYSVNKIDVNNFKPFIGGTLGLKGTIAAIPVAMLAYGSIIAIASIAGEIKNAKKTIPWIMIISIVLTVVVYVLILVSVFGMAPVDDFIQDPGRQYYPLAYALIRNTGNTMSFFVMIIPLGALLAITTTMLVLIMDSSRTIAALASKGLVPKYFSKINEKTGTPIRALALVSIISIALTLKPDLIWLMINTGSVCCGITVIFIAITLISLKTKRTDLYEKDAYHTPYGILFPVLTIIAVAITLALVYFGQDGQLTYLMTLIYFVLGLAIYLIRMITTGKKTVGTVNYKN